METCKVNLHDMQFIIFVNKVLRQWNYHAGRFFSMFVNCRTFVRLPLRNALPLMIRFSQLIEAVVVGLIHKKSRMLWAIDTCELISVGFVRTFSRSALVQRDKHTININELHSRFESPLIYNARCRWGGSGSSGMWNGE